MKKIIFITIALLMAFCCFAQEALPEEVEAALNPPKDPFEFVTTSVKANHATIDLDFNEMTGVLLVTYTIKDFSFDRADANTAIRDAVDNFSREKGYFKARLYPEKDNCSFYGKENTYRYQRFYILHDKGRL